MPQLSEPGRVWLPLAKTGAWQTVTINRISAPIPGRTIQDRDHGNDILVLPVGPRDAGKVIEIIYKVSRAEKSPYPSRDADAAR
ncbi:MAG: hypothetical protein M3463_01860 [Verrucomicrobiota bacterium]|nr:hypothetical protein [Verrucomicrobiota bacterium]